MSARRRRKAHADRYAHLHAPQAELDFHDRGPLTGSQIKRETLAFIAAAQERGLQRVVVITGRGTHSKKRPVAGPQVVRTLRALEAEGSIRGFASAKPSDGGEGALVVDL